MNKFHFTIVGVPPQTRPCPDPSISGGPPSLQCTLAPAHVLQASVLLEGGQHQLSWMSGKHGWESASPCAWGGSLWVYSPALPGGSGYPPSLHQGGGPPHLPTQAHCLSSAIQALPPPDKKALFFLQRLGGKGGVQNSLLFHCISLPLLGM